jgi:hypothetical protein
MIPLFMRLSIQTGSGKSAFRLWIPLILVWLLLFGLFLLLLPILILADCILLLGGFRFLLTKIAWFPLGLFGEMGGTEVHVSGKAGAGTRSVDISIV